MFKVAVIGDRNTAAGFKILGIEVYTTSDAKEVENILNKLIAEQCAIVYITEKLAIKAINIIKKFSGRLTPAIIPIPDHTGSTGYGIDNIKKFVEKAVGADILFTER